jgi:hypothetical protein
MTVLGKFGPSTFVILASSIADLHQFMQKLRPKNLENGEKKKIYIGCKPSLARQAQKRGNW